MQKSNKLLVITLTLTLALLLNLLLLTKSLLNLASLAIPNLLLNLHPRADGRLVNLNVLQEAINLCAIIGSERDVATLGFNPCPCSFELLNQRLELSLNLWRTCCLTLDMTTDAEDDRQGDFREGNVGTHGRVILSENEDKLITERLLESACLGVRSGGTNRVLEIKRLECGVLGLGPAELCAVENLEKER